MQSTVSIPTVAIARLVAAVARLTVGGPRFAGFNYRDKEAGELARRVLILGASYENVLSESIATLQLRDHIMVDATATGHLKDEIRIAGKGTPQAKRAKQALQAMQKIIGPERSAAAELYCSYSLSLAAMAAGMENPDYTKAGLYEPICVGVKVNRNDGSFEVCGLSHSKKVLEPGAWPAVVSSDKTIAKRAIEKTLPAGKYRTFALDAGWLESVRIGGNEIDVTELPELR